MSGAEGNTHEQTETGAAAATGTAREPACGIRVLRFADCAEYRWKNGLGSSRSIAAGSAVNGAPGWTLSIATVDASVAFSEFVGLDRHLMALSSHGLGLDIDSTRVELAEHEVAYFAGEASVSSVNVTQETLDLNLMVARSQWQGALTRETLDGMRAFDAADVLAITVLTGSATVVDAAGEAPLSTYDTVIAVGGTPLKLRGTATLAVARVVAVQH